eukprot:SAG31_NODE_2600_length_5414_cov_3.077140_9_plen_39_part_00
MYLNLATRTGIVLNLVRTRHTAVLIVVTPIKKVYMDLI